jgi:hypothetical protein
MAMSQMLTVSLLLIVYTVAMSAVGEGATRDEREEAHRYLSNRAALVGATVIISLGVLVQLFSHRLDFWLLLSLIVINVVKIVSLIYLDYKG